MLCLTKVQCYYNRRTNRFVDFCVKPAVRWILDTPKFRMPFFSGQFLLLSTTVLNDKLAMYSYSWLYSSYGIINQLHILIATNNDWRYFRQKWISSKYVYLLWLIAIVCTYDYIAIVAVYSYKRYSYLANGRKQKENLSSIIIWLYT